MPNYHVNKNAQAHGDREVHENTDCTHAPDAANRHALGAFTDCAGAVRDATENALKCYREASKARAAGDELEALGLCEIAEQSLDLARDVLCRIEGL